MIRIEHLSKQFGSRVALSDVNLSVGRGECLGLAGPNGSGRTTLLRIVATLSRPTAGLVEIDGLDVGRHVYGLRSRIGYVGEEPLIVDEMRVETYLRLVLEARRKKATHEIVEAAVERVGLDRTAATRQLSGGMRQRLALCAALIVRPDVLLLDDPLRGLDDAGRSLVIDWISDARVAGTTVVTTAQDDEIAAACTSVARFDAGRVVSVSAVAPSRPFSRYAVLR